MKHNLTSSRAAILLQVIAKILAAQAKSPVMMAAIDIDSHDLAKCQAILNDLKK